MLVDVVESEYAALRRGAALLDAPHRGTLRATGADRLDFLNRMVSHEVGTLKSGETQRAFLTNRKGRVQADLTVAALEAAVIIDLDIHQAIPVMTSLDAMLFGEDMRLDDLSDSHHHLSVHGPLTPDVLMTACGDPDMTLPVDGVATLEIDGVNVVAIMHRQFDLPSAELIMPVADAPRVWDFLIAADDVLADGKRRVRPIGWYAWNILRIEAGQPVMNIDFDPSHLPHETGLLADRVSFTKGCYPGQEVVARMQHLGKPKQQVVALRIEGDELPVSGSQVFEDGDNDVALGDPIGVVTSSTLSPMLAATPIAMAMIRTKFVRDGGSVRVNAEGEQVRARVQTELRAVPSDGAS